MAGLNSALERLYPHLPVFLQNAACVAYGVREGRVRYGRAFERHLAELLASDRAPRSQIEGTQDDRLRALVRRAYEHVPFYRDRMRAAKLTPDDIRTRADLPKLPLLRKEDVRMRRRELVADDVRPRQLIEQHTSGTTGKASSSIRRSTR